MQDGRKAVWSIPYISEAFFPSLKTEFLSVQFAFLKFTSFDNQDLVGYIPIPVQ